MNLIGKPVYKVWAVNALRFGNVIGEKMKDGRKYVKVDWKDDEAYEMDIARIVELRNVKYNEEYEWYRADSVKVFDPTSMSKTLGKLNNEKDI